MILDELHGPILLRETLHMFVADTDSLEDPLSAYGRAITQVGNLEFDRGSRLSLTKEYVLRILKRNKKHFENIFLRDTMSHFEDTLDSASEQIPE